MKKTTSKITASKITAMALSVMMAVSVCACGWSLKIDEPASVSDIAASVATTEPEYYTETECYATGDYCEEADYAVEEYDTGYADSAADSYNMAPSAAMKKEAAYDTGYEEAYDAAYSDGAYVDSLYDAAYGDGAYADSLYDAGPCEEVAWNGCFIPYNDDYYGETYKKLVENSFEDVKNAPLSTFAADVDTASYSNFRRMIEDGSRLCDIPQGAVRAEEMVNYFKYNYKTPTNGDPFAVDATIIDCPWNKENKLLTLGIKADEIEKTEDIASNLVFLVDVSGSMSDYDKLPLLKMAFEMLTDELGENDRVSIVTYASSVDVVLAGARGDQKTEIKKAMNSLTADGGTYGEGGIRKAYKIAQKYFVEGGNNRILIATDGDLNIGATTEEELTELVEEKRDNGIFLSVLGFGTGNYTETTLETLADKGNGNYSYIDSLKEAGRVLVDEYDSTLYTIAKDTKFQIEFNPAYVKEYRQIGYENRSMAARDFNDDTKDGGEIGAGHSVTAMYEIILKDDYDEDDDLLDLNIRFKRPSEDESELLTYTVDFDSYKSRPGDDFKFQSAVAEFGLIASHSEYAGKSNLDDVLEILEDTDLNDEYKEEFYEMVSGLI